MSYNLVYTHRAEKDIKKLDSSIKRQMGKAILKLQGNPLEYSEKLTDPKIGHIVLELVITESFLISKAKILSS